jgi:hypothetical protein
MKHDLLLIILLLSAVAGCGPRGLSGLSKINGTITLNGHSLEGATITLVPSILNPQSARAASGLSDANGKFQLTTLNSGDGVFPGDYTVYVSKIISEGDILSPSEIRNRGLLSEQLSEITKPKQMIPEKYTLPETSGLTITVKPGRNPDLVIDIEE